MKKLLLAVGTVALVSGVCFAQQPVAPVAPVAPVSQVAAAVQKVESLKIKGTVEAVVVADAAKGTKAEITVVEEKGKSVKCVVSAETPIMDKETKASVSVDKIKKGEKIVVKYTTNKEGLNIAEAIKILD
ncbi:MAG: hypothetical protein HQL26_10730 [Candidatus Omnitrophica bacterium]|nr:hypothetical protein [Candidatus Omnitrophota bacterium]